MMRIELKNVNKSYNNNNKVLDDISFIISENSITGYLDANGSGKSTTIKLLLGLIKADEGEVTINGINLYQDSDSSLSIRESIGCMLEYDTLYHDITAKENIKYWGQLYGLNEVESKLKADRLLDKMKLKNILVSEYSNGMKKRLSFAKSIIHDPKIIILDEPTSGVDFESKIIIREIITELHEKGSTIFLSSHDLEEVHKICTDIIIIDQGKIQLQGRLEDVMRDKEYNTIEDVYTSFVGDNNEF
ncbi:MAG: ABC transporter ATP-binding protein [Methanobrevibacter sp.]|jgi:ABC-type multidrug transport system ATPase subunit|nr:ABC transporter ATP-binding protein [Methanobrevibacter sp.]